MKDYLMKVYIETESQKKPCLNKIFCRVYLKPYREVQCTFMTTLKQDLNISYISSQNLVLTPEYYS